MVIKQLKKAERFSLVKVLAMNLLENAEKLLSIILKAIEESRVDHLNEDSLIVLGSIFNLFNRRLVKIRNFKKLVFVGDLHGDFESLERVYRRYSSVEQVNVVFLGDYVDRGPRQLETLLGVLYWKMQQPEKVVMLRGNHESPSMNLSYGFLSALKKRLGRIYSVFYRDFIEKLYLRLPVAMLAESNEKRIFAVHGGLPIKPFKIEEIEEIDSEVEPRNEILMQLLWNDPNDKVKTYANSYRGYGIYFFGNEIFEKFIEENKIDLMVRAHEPVEGVASMFGNRLYTVFTCRYYGIKPAVLEVKQSLEVNPVFLE